MFGIFLFCLDLELLQKLKNIWLLHTQSNQFFTLLLITQDLNKIKKNPEHPFADIVKYKTYKKFQQNILSFIVAGARQSFRFLISPK